MVVQILPSLIGKSIGESQFCAAPDEDADGRSEPVCRATLPEYTPWHVRMGYLSHGRLLALLSYDVMLLALALFSHTMTVLGSIWDS